MNTIFKVILPTILICAAGEIQAKAQLSVTVSPVAVTGQKAIVPLAMRNDFAEKIESARATVFLLDERGKMAGQTAQWVIGGNKNRPGLAAGATNVFNVVVTGSKPFSTTNLTARLNFSRLILDGGKAADPKQDVRISGQAQ
jgi:hypothetical protein